MIILQIVCRLKCMLLGARIKCCLCKYQLGDFGMLCLPRQNFNMTIASLDYDRL